MKKKNLWSAGAAVAIALFFLTSCTKTAPDIVTKDGDLLQEQDETQLWLKASKSAANEAVGTKVVFASGLNNPRGLKFSPTGWLYVAEAGDGGGDNTTIGICEQVALPVGPYHGGPTGGRISKINWKGVRTTVTDQLPSSHANELIGGDVEGVSDVAFIGNELYALLAGAGCSHAVADVPNGVIKVAPNGSWQMIADLSSWFKAHPVAKPEPSDFEPDGVPFSMVNVGGDFYVLEPNHGDFVKVTTSGHITRIADISASQGHIVPTALTYHGNFFVGNLRTFPIVDGSSNIYKITPSGQVKIWAKGFTTVLGVVFDNRDRMYVLENTTGGNPFPFPGTGKITRVDPSGNKTTIATGLSLPTALTFGPDGKLYVSNWGFSPFALGGGEILQINVGND